MGLPPLLRRLLPNLALLLVTVLLLTGLGEWLCRRLGQSQMVVVDSLQAATGPRQLEQHAFGNEAYRYSRTGSVALVPRARIRIRHHFVSGRDITFTTNSAGYRGPEVGPKPPGEFRVLLLGDSITLADYLPDEETFAFRLERLLQASGRRVRVINLGIGSADTETEYAILRDAGLAMQPDLVLVAMYLNDGYPSLRMRPRSLSGWLGKSYLAGLVYQSAQRLWFEWTHWAELRAEGQAWVHEFARGRQLRPGNWRTDPEAFDALIVRQARDWGAAWSPAAWQRIEAALGRIEQAGRQHGFRLAAALLPVRHQVEAHQVHNEPQRRFRDLMTRHHLPHEDLLPALRAAWQQAPHRPLFYDHCHHTPFAADLVAQRLAAFLLREGLVPAP
ncbi:MAG: hypothetical protein RMK29_15775 [Myxococcales bacterium]|nr:hypothetical protein [Myxococcales bacterium]